MRCTPPVACRTVRWYARLVSAVWSIVCTEVKRVACFRSWCDAPPLEVRSGARAGQSDEYFCAVRLAVPLELVQYLSWFPDGDGGRYSCSSSSFKRCRELSG